MKWKPPPLSLLLQNRWLDSQIKREQRQEDDSAPPFPSPQREEREEGQPIGH